MQTPTVDIIVPVWNSPFETRACLASILEHSPDARLIIVDNGSSRETELMLEEFSEALGDNGLFIKSDRNVGLVPAINIGLSRSDSDFAVIVRPHVLVSAGWLTMLLDAAAVTGAGIVSPLFSGVGAPPQPVLTPGCSVMESCTISFAALLLRSEMRIMAGGFDECLDGGEWCLREYVRRAASVGYTCCVTRRSVLSCSADRTFGSSERRHEITRSSRTAYLERWGVSRHYAVYFGKDAAAESLSTTIDTILDGARQGHRFSLLLHHRQFSDFRRMGWNGLHTGIELFGLSMLFPLKSLRDIMNRLLSCSPDMVPVRGITGILFPQNDAAIPIDELITYLAGCSPHSVHPLEVPQ